MKTEASGAHMLSGWAGKLAPILPNFAWPLLLVVVWSCACSIGAAESGARVEGEKPKRVMIAHDRWHAAIVLDQADIPAVVLPEVRDFPWSDHLEFSWGDKDYFPASEPGLGLALKAAFWSSGSILHVVGFSGSARNYYPAAEILELRLSEQAFRRLLEFVSDTFSRAEASTPAEAQPGLFPNARFYPARGHFSILRTCNSWVAEALNAAGLRLKPGCAITAGSLGRQLRPFSITE